jgi:transglycosylase-like protein with SLT domain/sporulation related protein
VRRTEDAERPERFPVAPRSPPPGLAGPDDPAILAAAIAARNCSRRCGLAELQMTNERGLAAGGADRGDLREGAAARSSGRGAMRAGAGRTGESATRPLPTLRRSTCVALALLALSGAAPACAEPRDAAASAPETLDETVCRLIEASAQARRLPVAFLTRLIWRESGFHAEAASPAGALGIAQFMPGTASERGLKDPFDPEQAIPEAAALLADLLARFGNLGLAAAAYNAGPARVAAWRAGAGGLPEETRAYVLLVTGRSVEDWTAAATPALADAALFPEPSCLKETAALRGPEPAALAWSAEGAAPAPWGVQLAGSFSKPAALAAYARARARFAAALGDAEPMVLGARLRSRGFGRFWTVRAPAASRAEAEALCARILRGGGACVALRS